MTRAASVPDLRRLRCRPVRVRPAYEGWLDLSLVELDGHILSKCAWPFSGQDDLIELNADTLEGLRGFGKGFVAVRRFAHYVVWMNPTQWPPDGPPYNPSPGLPMDTVHWFDRDQYRLACGTGEVSQLPLLSTPEYLSILAPSLAPLREALYVDGLSPTPARTAAFLRDFAAAIGEKPIELSESDPDFAHLREIGIGLDVQGNPESRFWLARSGDSWCIRCIAHPCIPVWISSTALTDLLAPYTLTHRPSLE